MYCLVGLIMGFGRVKSRMDLRGTNAGVPRAPSKGDIKEHNTRIKIEGLEGDRRRAEELGITLPDYLREQAE